MDNSEKCLKCRFEIPAGNLFCPGCGNKLTHSADSSTVEKHVSSNKSCVEKFKKDPLPKKTIKSFPLWLTFLAAGGVTGFFIVVIVIAYSMSTTKKNPASSYYETNSNTAGNYANITKHEANSGEAQKQRPTSLASDKANNKKKTVLREKDSGRNFNNDLPVKKVNRVNKLQNLIKEATLGNDVAQYKLGMLYKTGNGVSVNHKEAAKWFYRSALRNNANSEYEIGLCYEKGMGVKQSKSTARRWYSRSANAGNAVAQTRFGAWYFSGIGCVKNQYAALRWFRKAAAQYNRDSQYNLGICYLNGYGGVSKSKRTAKKWFKKAAAQGQPGAIKMLKQFK